MDANSDPRELAKFEAIASRWWDPAGEMMALHRMNPVRLAYVDARASLAGKRCVDVGCGGGLLAEGLAARAAAVLGIDLAPGPLTVARLHATESGLDNLSYRETGAAELAAAEPDGFDVVTCMEVLEHVPDPGALMRELGRLARPGGDVIVSTLNRGPKSFAMAIVGAEYLLGLVPRGTHEYDRLIRPSELEAWARAAGLQLLDLAGLVFDPLSRTARLSDDVGVNYLAHFRRPAASA
jgi:2-polyprenyl-6-hydroxyphenyl methylase/3-demethylubiquinone-9 3-methyltransferase